MTRLLQTGQLNLNLQDKWYKTALMLAIEHHRSRMFDKLLASKGLITSLQNYFGETALHMAVKSDNLSYVQKLMAKSTDEINATDYDGNTPLHMAACAGYQAIVEQLLTAEGINVTLKNRGREDAKSCADSGGHNNTTSVIGNYMIKHNISSIDDGEAGDEDAID